MSKTKIISFIAIGLLVLNLALIAVLFTHQKHRPAPRERPRNIIIESLQFDEAQIKEYDKLITEHRSAIENQEKNILSLKNQLYSSLSVDEDSLLVISLEQQLGQLQIGIEELHYEHFQQIKNLCRPNQLDHFNELMKNISEIFSPPRPMPKKK